MQANAKWVVNPSPVEAGENQQVKEKSGWAARQRRGLHMLSKVSCYGTQSSAIIGDKKAGLHPKGRNKLWKGSKSLRPPSITLKRETCVARTGTSQLFLLC